MKSMQNSMLKKIPTSYRDAILKVIKDAKKIYDKNLNSIFLAGSTGKGNCIENWSDIDLYIITNKLNLEQNLKFYQKTNEYGIHIGTTFYTKKMLINLCIDQKTKVAFYEYHNYNVNGLVYGNIDIPIVDFKEIAEDKSLPDLIQTVERELYNYKLYKNNLKSLVKKTSLLIRFYLETKRKIFVFGYSNVFKTFNTCENIDNNYDIYDIIKNSDKDNTFERVVESILLRITKERDESMKRICARGLVVTDKGLAVIYRKKKSESGVSEYYVIPGGGVEENEEITQALKRELREELNIEVNVKDLAFVIDADNRIEYFYNCDFVSGSFELNGEEIDRMSESNYYEPTFIELKDLNNYEILKEIKDYYNK